jgi:hypothetical protein
MRVRVGNDNSSKQKNQNSTIEDDLRWVEENIPTTITEA